MSIQIYPFPEGEINNQDFAITINEQAAPIHEAKVSAYPFNRRWPGHQRSPDQSELAYFISFAMNEPVMIRIRPRRAFQEAVVRPLSQGIVPLVADGSISFMIKNPGGYTLELDGYHHALHIFADPFQAYAVNLNDPDTLYFGPGRHDPGMLRLKSGQTVFIDAGAIVYTCIQADNAENIRIIGQGIIDNSRNKEEILFGVDQPGDGLFAVSNSRRKNTLQLVNCQNAEIDGITIRDSLVYNIAAWGCADIRINNIKTIGCWRYNTDGIDLHNCRHCVVSNCFVRTFDDSICVKGDPGYQLLCEDVLIENCVIWCDWGHALEIGAETRVEQIRNITYRNCDIIRNCGVALDIMNVDYGDVHDVLYEDIRVEYDPVSQPQQFQKNDQETYLFNTDSGYMPLLIGEHILEHSEYSGGLDRRGQIRDIRFSGIRVYAHCMPPSSFNGFDASHKVARVKITDLSLNDRKIRDLGSANISCGDFAEQITVG